MIGIYKITNKENGKVYIGQSIDIDHRKATHFHDLKRNRSHCRHLQHAFNQNPEAFEFSLLCECSEDELNDKEIYYISLYDSTNQSKGYNIDKGGNGAGRMSEETKKKLSISKMGNKAMKGIKLSEEWKKNLSKAQPHKKMIECVESGVIYESFAEASRLTGLNRTKIVSCCTGKRKSTGGFHWRYCDGQSQSC